jgi:hypothetical protein
MIIDTSLQSWLLKGDVSIRYQVYRDLFKEDKPELKARIAREGWGARLHALRNEKGHWGQGFYQPKWTSTHYSLLDLRNLCFPNADPDIAESIRMILRENKAPDGGINPCRSIVQSDACINGMVLNYARYFGAREEDLKSIVDFILANQLSDGGFNCHFNRSGATHSSMHTTLSMVEGINEYARMGNSYRLGELKRAEAASGEFMLQHWLYKSHRTGKTMDEKMLMLSYPSRWRYDILRSLDYFRVAGQTYDERMSDALNVLIKKQRSDSRWPLQAKHSGKTHFEMEAAGEASRWNTLRALRVISHFGWIDRLK